MKRETRGGKTRLGRALTKRICGLLAKGSTIKSACILCNIGERTYFDWQKRGKAGEQPYETFFFAVTRAREQYRAESPTTRRVEPIGDDEQEDPAAHEGKLQVPMTARVSSGNQNDSGAIWKRQTALWGRATAR